MEITRPPYAIQPAFNPCILVVTASDLDIASGLTGTFIRVSDQNGSESTLIERDFINKDAFFDYSGELKRYLKDEISVITDGLYRDYRLFVTYDIIVDDSFNEFESLLALNGVCQIGESSDWTTQRGTFRTLLDKINVYEGYPADVSVLPFNGFTESTKVYFDNIQVGSPQGLLDGYFSIRLQTDKSQVSIVSESGAQKTVLPLETHCVPSNPFYVRWINNLGGWDYWMFSFRQNIEKDIASQQTYSPTVLDQETATSSINEYYKTAEKTITVGAEGLSLNEFECLSRIPYSNRIEYYDKGKDKWFGMITESGSSDNDTRSTEKYIEFTFSLPNPQLQV